MSDSYCTIEFDGASKGNPGKGGAGAVIRNSRGDVVARTNKPLGSTTNNVAEYEALILGLEEAQKMGYKDVRGDVVARTNKPLGYTTNNVAEYEALILRLEEAQKMGYIDVAHTNKRLGYITNNVAEYEDLILGLEEAQKMGYKDVHARGDSHLVCNQVE